jgi:hypothetical protein
MFTVDLSFTDEDVTQPYVFDHHNPNWVKTHEHNLFFLRAHQNLLNDLLRARGHILLNDAFDVMGAPRTVAGAVFGWALGFDHPSVIEFTFEMDDLSGAIIVHFNLQGVVIDKIESSYHQAVAQYDITRPDKS